MIINKTPESQAVISNVQTTGNFALKASSKAFQILSSSLYANKIKAIIRELSCNAVDSHVAAGKGNVPFTIHLPNQIDPYFSIRDYGTGLSKDQVLNLYVTYFDSTKADSNDYIGAMGLGSKSPFSYTDNYSVTAIKDGVKGLYTAYIDDNGMPSIALMTECETDEPNGVEIKFAVSYRDFYRFQCEASEVFKYFKLRPEITGVELTIQEPTYVDKDIIPGVHYTGNKSNAVMGNISYPISIPNSEEVLGDLHDLLQCGFEMHFDIGELDFQASREGLSYIQMTVDSIRRKLEAVSSSLYNILEERINAIPTVWDKKCKLYELKTSNLFKQVANRYCNNNNITWFKNVWRESEILISEEVLAEKFNISLSVFSHYSGKNSPISAKRVRANNSSDYEICHTFVASARSIFVENDTKVGVTERAKYHWRNSAHSFTSKNSLVYVINPHDRKLPINLEAFYDFIGNPSNIIKASELKSLPTTAKTGTAKKAHDEETIVELTYGPSPKSRYVSNVNWGRHRSLSSFSDNATHYYVLVSGYNLISEYNVTIHQLFRQAYDELGVHFNKVYAVRKDNLEAVKAKSNWVNFEEHVIEILKKKRPLYETLLVKNHIGERSLGPLLRQGIPASIEDTDIGKLVNSLRSSKLEEVGSTTINRIYEQFKMQPINVEDRVKEATAVVEKYGMLRYIETYNDLPTEVLEAYVKQCNNAVVEQ